MLYRSIYIGNPAHLKLYESLSCYQSQNYKIWKQFTKCISK